MALLFLIFALLSSGVCLSACDDDNQANNVHSLEITISDYEGYSKEITFDDNEYKLYLDAYVWHHSTSPYYDEAILTDKLPSSAIITAQVALHEYAE